MRGLNSAEKKLKHADPHRPRSEIGDFGDGATPSGKGYKKKNSRRP